MEKGEELISIIILVYNVEDYLKKCIESVLAQSYTNLQIILIDDGSTDNSGNICELYRKRDERIDVIHTSNKGVSNARNIGLAAAKGTYIGFVDADDWIDNNMYMYLYKIINMYNADISSIESCRTDDESKKIINKNEKIVEYNREQYMKHFFKIGSQKILYYVYNKLYRKTLFVHEHIFPIEYSIGEDVLASYRMISNAKKIVSSNCIMYYYRQMSGVTATFSNKYFKLVDVWKDVVEESLNNSLNDFEYAKVNLDRVYFTVLSELAVTGEYKNENYTQIVSIYIGELKKRIKELLKADIAVSRKIIMLFYMINYRTTAFFLNKFIKKRQ